MPASRSTDLVAWLRAAGEPSRLRLLALCSQRDLSVSDLAQALGQSEPRVSRHLRILCESGLVARLRQGQWVHYRLSSHSPAAGFVQGLLAQLDRGDPQLSRDRERAQIGSAGVAPPTKTSESRLGRALKDFLEMEGSGWSSTVAGPGVATATAELSESALAERSGSALVIGVEHLELLESAAALADECTAIAHSRRAAQSARAFAERRGFACRVLLASSPEGLSERDLARAGRLFDVVILDHLAATEIAFAGMLAFARRALAPAGRLWLFERYEALESSRSKVVEHPLARLRRLLGDLGLQCERLSPIEADGEHVLAAVAVSMARPGETTLRRA